MTIKDLRIMWSDGEAIELTWEILPWNKTFSTYLPREKEKQINLIY